MRGRSGAITAKVIRSRSGSVAAEFALVTPIFFSLLFGALEYGSIGYSMSSMQQAANVVARDVAVNSLTQEQAESRLARHLPSWLDGKVNLQLTESHPGEPRINTVSVRLEVPASSATPISIFTRAASWDIVSEANVQQEMPYDNVIPAGQGG